MILYRLEHVQCPTGLQHGPGNPPGYESSCWAPAEDVPYRYGYRHEPPREIYPDERCLVDLQQLPLWADDELDPDDLAESGWRFVAYDVPDEDVRLDGLQYVGRLANARVVDTFKPAELLRPLPDGQLALDLAMA